MKKRVIIVSSLALLTATQGIYAETINREQSSKKNTVEFSIDDIKDVVYSFQLSLKITGDVKLSNIEWDTKITKDAIANYKYNETTNILDIYVTSDKDLVEAGSIKVGKISVVKTGTNTNYDIVSNTGSGKSALKLVTYNHKEVLVSDADIKISGATSGFEATEGGTIAPPSGGSGSSGSDGSTGGSGSGSGGSSSDDNTESNTTVYELIGSDRFETATKISKKGWSSSDTVIVVNGEDKNLVDGLTATPLANIKNAPILLSSNEKLPQETINEIKRLNASKIIVIGGESAMPNSVVEALKNINSKINVARIGGATRYETSLNIAKEINKTQDINKVYIGAGNGEADSLSIASVAGKEKAPIILTQKDGLDTNTYNFIKEEAVQNAYFIGGDAKISNQAIEQVNKITTKDVSNNRIAGQTRQETNAKVIEKFYTDEKLDGVIIAKEDKLIDALAVGPLAAKINNPVVLATNMLNPQQEGVLKEKKTSTILEVGGGIKDAVIDAVKNLLK